MRFIITLIASLILLIPVSAQDQWEIVNEGIDYDFSFVDFINKDTGWIAGEKGLFKTTDGAESWTLVYDDTTLHEIDFYNDTIGWAYIKGWSSPDPDACIIKTLDGGHTWFRQRKVSSGVGIYVVSDSVVYTIERRDYIFRTVDGGTSWENITPSQGSDFQSAYFFISDTGIVMGHDSIIFRTFNGGKTWDRIDTGFGRLGSLRLIDGSTGYFTAWKDTSNLICKTTDTFSNWSVIAESPDYLRSCHVFADDTIIAIRSIGGWSISNRCIIKSTDGGATWKLTDHMQITSNGWGYSINLHVVENVAYLFAMSGGGMSFILKSTDLGTHWKCLNLTFPMQDVHFINREIGFIAGRYSGFHHSGGFLLKTQDEGRTWDPVYNPGFVPGGIHFVNDSLGFITGGGMSMLHRMEGKTGCTMKTCTFVICTF